MPAPHDSRRLTLLTAVVACGALLAWWALGSLPSRTVTPAVEPASPRAADGAPLRSTRAPEERDAVVPEHAAPKSSSETPAENAGDLRVLVETPRSVPLEGAEVFSVRDDEVASLGKTGASGVLTTAADEAARILVAVSDGYRNAEAVVSGPGQVTLRLGDGAAIRGSVRMSDGSPLPGDLHVFVAPSTAVPAARERSVALRDPRVLRARPDATGYFECGGLDPSGTYVVTAAGSGHVAREPATGTRPEGEPVQLDVERLYGLGVRMEDAAGGPLRTSASVHEDGTSLRFPPDVTDASNRTWELGLAGRTPSEREPGTRTVLFMRPGAADSCKVRFDVRVPGYERTGCDLSARWLGLGPSEEVVRLERTASEWGRLRIAFEGPPADAPGLRTPGTLAGTVTLETPSGSAYRVDVPLGALAEEHVVSLPVGSYGATFHSVLSRFRHPENGARTILIGRDEAELRIPVRELSFLVLRLGEGRREHEGQAIVRLSTPGRRGLKHWRFAAAPYVLPCVPPGPYRIAAITGDTFVGPGAEPFSAEIVAAAGSVQTVVLDEKEAR